MEHPVESQFLMRTVICISTFIAIMLMLIFLKVLVNINLHPRFLLPVCRVEPENLLGHIPINLSPDLEEMDPVSRGGSYCPPTCVSSSKVAVVVPYRDRKTHLEVLLHHLHPVLVRQNLHYTVFVVDQAGEETFNR